MLKKIIETASNRAAKVIGMWVIAASIAASSVMLSLGKAAIEDNTSALLQYEKITTQMRNDLKAVKSMADELRETSFDDKLRSLSKQAYKLLNDPGDIKPSDMVAAADFCDSHLFSDYEDTLGGSRKVWVRKSCNDANEWLKNSPH